MKEKRNKERKEGGNKEKTPAVVQNKTDVFK
jgi:hypothetical protein